MQKQLSQADARNVVDGESHSVRSENRFDSLAIGGVEGDVIHRARARGPRRHADAGVGRIRAIGFPFGDVDTGYVSDIQPVAGERHGRAGADAHAESIAVKVPRTIEVVREHEKMFDVRQRHDVVPLRRSRHFTMIEALDVRVTRETGPRGDGSLFGDALGRPGAQFVVQYFDAPRSFVARAEHGADEPADVEFTVAAQAAMIDRIFEQAPRSGKRPVVDFDAADESHRKAGHVLVRNAEFYDVPQIEDDPAVWGVGGGHQFERVLKRIDAREGHELKQYPRPVVPRLTA